MAWMVDTPAHWHWRHRRMLPNDQGRRVTGAGQGDLCPQGKRIWRSLLRP